MLKKLTILFFVPILITFLSTFSQRSSEAVPSAETIPRFEALNNIETAMQSMPTEYYGVYQQLSSEEIWGVVISISAVKELSSSDIEVKGIVHYVSKKTRKNYKSKIRLLINTQTLDFIMEEIYSEKEDGFVPMVYRGTISSDLRYIRAKWVSGSSKVYVLRLIGSG